MQYWWVYCFRVVSHPDLTRSQIDADRADEDRMRIAIEFGVYKEGYFPTVAMDLDDIRPVYLTHCGTTASHVDTEDWVQAFQRGNVDVEIIWKKLSDF